jgi:hypothetical protein
MLAMQVRTMRQFVPVLKTRNVVCRLENDGHGLGLHDAAHEVQSIGATGLFNC